jgi:hypothetical protein
MPKKKPSGRRPSSRKIAPRGSSKRKGGKRSAEGTRSEVREFLIVALPEQADVGANLKLLAVAGSQAAAEKQVEQLDSGIQGRVGVLERRALFIRRSAIETVAVSGAITKR